MTDKSKVNSADHLSESEKDLLISLMLEHPDELSDGEIEQILADDELRDIYSISVDVKVAKRHQAEIDPAEEWTRFAPRLKKNHRPIWALRIAAIFIGVLLIGATIYLISDRDSSSGQPEIADIPEPTELESAHPLLPDTVAVDEKEQMTQPRRNSSPMLAEVSSKQKGEEQTTVEIEECLRVQQARMENDLAMQRAEALLNQYYAMAEMQDGLRRTFDTEVDFVDALPIDDGIETLIIP